MESVAVFGGLGYVGAALLDSAPHDLRTHVFDVGYFVNCLVPGHSPPETNASVVTIKDVRDISHEDLVCIDHVIYLSALSNDPIGREFDLVTREVNALEALRIAEIAKRAGARTFVFASSASVYGAGSSYPRAEKDETMPLTSYASSKVEAERLLETLADEAFFVTCLRFATACGFSSRVRLDLVLNDFVASALSTGRITVLSDGTPWRPLIAVEDMSKVLWWAASDRRLAVGSRFEVINVGSDLWNFQVKDLAHAVTSAIPGTSVHINREAPSDKRSYRVDFSKLKDLEPTVVPTAELTNVIHGLVRGLGRLIEATPDFRTSDFVRLNTLRRLRGEGRLGEDLRWI